MKIKCDQTVIWVIDKMKSLISDRKHIFCGGGRRYLWRMILLNDVCVNGLINDWVYRDLWYVLPNWISFAFSILYAVYRIHHLIKIYVYESHCPFVIFAKSYVLIDFSCVIKLHELKLVGFQNKRCHGERIDVHTHTNTHTQCIINFTASPNHLHGHEIIGVCAVLFHADTFAKGKSIKPKALMRHCTNKFPYIFVYYISAIQYEQWTKVNKLD